MFSTERLYFLIDGALLVAVNLSHRTPSQYGNRNSRLERSSSMLPREVVNIFAVRSGIRTSFTAGNLLIEIVSLLFFFALFVLSVPAYSAVFNISSGDVTGLIAAINAANANGEENTINLEPGTYTLTGVNTELSGLPSIQSVMTINGDGAENTIIERHPGATG
jgi:hypothetical protein